MNTATRHALSAYVQTGIESAVPEADPHRLVMMLFDGALASIADARLNMIRGQIAARGKAISKAISIVDQGLKCSLDAAKGGEIAERLDALYEYICARLLDANIKGRPEALDEPARLLTDLQSAWAAIARPAGSLQLVHGAQN
ncbi:MAG: fliS [Betaproteobacteria bacterium]|jgi:flagellar protein FliS|nr:fliS [Betaproteobacteria bacterium]